MRSVIATIVMGLLLIGASGSMVLAAGCCGGFSSTGFWSADLLQAGPGQYSGGSLPSCCSAGAYGPDAGRLRAPNSRTLSPCCQPSTSGQVSKSADVKGPVRRPVVPTSYATSGRIPVPGSPGMTAKIAERAGLPGCCAGPNTPVGATVSLTKESGTARSLWALLGTPLREGSESVGTAPRPSGIAASVSNVLSLPATWTGPAAAGPPHPRQVAGSNSVGLPPCCAGAAVKP